MQGASTVIDSLTGNLDDVTVGLRAGAPAADIVWRRLAANAQRLFATSVRPGSTTPPRTRTELTTGPSSGYEPRWVDGADGTRRLVYDLRTTSAERTVTNQVYGPASSLPGTGVASQPGLVVAANGTRMASRQDGGRVFIADAAPGAAYGAAVTPATAGYARDVQIVQGADGTVLVAWLASTGRGNAVQIASRPPGGTFGATVTIVPGPEGAYAPRLVATSAREFMLGWTATGRTSGYASSAGTLRLQRLTAAGTPVGSITALTASGTRANDVVFAHDGTGSVLAAWGRVDGNGRRTIQARRIAPGGIIGVIRNLSPHAGAHLRRWPERPPTPSPRGRRRRGRSSTASTASRMHGPPSPSASAGDEALPRHHLRLPDERARLRAHEGHARVARLREARGPTTPT